MMTEKALEEATMSKIEIMDKYINTFGVLRALKLYLR